MRPSLTGVSKARSMLVLAPLALAGCVSGGYLYDYPQGGYYSGSGAGYYSGYHSGYYGDYNGYPPYYQQNYYRPRIVYYDHIHDRYDCRHESHRDRDGQDSNDARPPPHRLPPPGAAPLRRTPRAAPQQGAGPAPKATPASVPCKGRANCGPSGEAPEPKRERKEREYLDDRRR